MAVKTITIDLEAYEILARHKKPGQSFSQVIKERLRPVTTGRDLLKAIERAHVSEDFLDQMERVIADRSKSPARAPKL
jgi:predicted CopG family antitoxin